LDIKGKTGIYQYVYDHPESVREVRANVKAAYSFKFVIKS